VVDDLGKDRATEWAEQILYQVIDTRYRENRPIVATSNFALPDLQEQYPNVGPAIVSRLVEMCQGVKIVGFDWRMRRLG
jgi:DNA replication protein DnaC